MPRHEVYYTCPPSVHRKRRQPPLFFHGISLMKMSYYERYCKVLLLCLLQLIVVGTVKRGKYTSARILRLTRVQLDARLVRHNGRQAALFGT
jgi:hypothetical protein